MTKTRRPSSSSRISRAWKWAGGRACGLKAGDPSRSLSQLPPSCRPPWPSSGPALGENGYNPTKARQARRPAVQAGPHAHTQQQLTRTHTSVSIAGNCQATAVHSCVVMWLHPLLHRPSFNGAGLLAADPVTQVTQRLLLPSALSFPLCLSPACLLSHRSEGRVRLSSARR